MPLKLLAGPVPGGLEVGGEVSGHGHRDDEGDADPEGPVEVGLAPQDVGQEGLAGARNGGREDAALDVRGVHVEELLVEAQGQEVGAVEKEIEVQEVKYENEGLV